MRKEQTNTRVSKTDYTRADWLQKLNQKPLLQFSVVVATIAICEAIVMLILHFWQVDGKLAIFVDSIMLSILLFPVLSFLLLRPQVCMIQSLQKAQEALRKTVDKIEAANQAKKEFLANMSHELRTPMNAIVGFSDLLKDEPLTDQQLDYIETIHASSQHLLALINDVLDISKIEAGKEEVVLGICSIGDMLGQLEDLMRNNAQSKGLRFELEVCEDVPEQVIIDAKHLYQCLINLVGNAIKFTERGSIMVRASRVGDASGPLLSFEVADTGIGIPEDRQTKVFESFEQADTSTSRKYGGTGLGLSITRQLIELMGGTISVESQEDIGSIFTITLPLEPVLQPVA